MSADVGLNWWDLAYVQEQILTFGMLLNKMCALEI